jgi:hypothetical protein
MYLLPHEGPSSSAGRGPLERGLRVAQISAKRIACRQRGELLRLGRDVRCGTYERLARLSSIWLCRS